MGHYYSEMHTPPSKEQIEREEKLEHKALKDDIRQILKQSTHTDNLYLKMLVEIWRDKEDWKGIYNLLNKEK